MNQHGMAEGEDCRAVRFELVDLARFSEVCASLSRRIWCEGGYPSRLDCVGKLCVCPATSPKNSNSFVSMVFHGSSPPAIVIDAGQVKKPAPGGGGVTMPTEVASVEA